jgi:predicted HicB family RNase H-like nuclease
MWWSVAAKKSVASDDDRQGLMLRLPKNLHTALRHLSIDRGVSLNALITEVLEQWWGEQPERTRYARTGSARR